MKVVAFFVDSETLPHTLSSTTVRSIPNDCAKCDEDFGETPGKWWKCDPV